MKILVTLFRSLMLLTLLALTASLIQAQTSTFTYQGRLTDGGTPPTGTYDMQFKLYDTATVGTGALQGSPNTVTNSIVNVTNGVFTVQLDFGPSGFPGADRFLEINVRHPGDPTYTTLAPRSQLTATPYAIRALTAATATNNVLKSGDTMTGQLVLSGDPVVGPGAATKQYVDSGDDLKLNLAGGGMTGVLDMGSNRITSLANPTNGTDAANKSYVDSVVSGGTGIFPWVAVSGTAQQALSNTGYVATNSGQVTITLPPSPNVGDIVRVSGAGAGGWKIAQNTGQSILGSTVVVPGVNWAPHESNRDWVSVASSADGSKLVAGIIFGQIYTSTDSGVSWTPRESNRLWQSVASSADGSKLVAVDATPGKIYTSTDSGVSWTPRESDRGWIAIASSSNGSKLVAAAQGGQLYTSTDSGVSWTPRDSTRNWFSVTSSTDGINLVAVVAGGQIYTSTDSGANWTPRESSRNWRSVASSTDGIKLVAVAIAAQIYTSTDAGVNWTPRESIRSWRSVASSTDGMRLVAVVAPGQIYTSTDSGLSWTPREGNRPWTSVASSADGSRLVSVVVGGQIYTSTTDTTVGTAGFLSGGRSTTIELQYIGNGQFLPLSHEGTFTSQ